MPALGPSALYRPLNMRGFPEDVVGFIQLLLILKDMHKKVITAKHYMYRS